MTAADRRAGSTVDAQVRLHRHGPEVATDRSLRQSLLQVYVGAFGAPVYPADHGRAHRWAHERLPEHAVIPGFALFTASAGGQVLGFGYGYLGAPGQWFDTAVRQLVAPQVADAWLGGHGELVELAVLPRARGAGVGGRLHDAVLDHLAGTGATKALLVVDRRAVPARRLYASRGWAEIADLGSQSTLMATALGSGTTQDR